MADPLGSVDFDRWYIAWLVISLVLLIACIAAHERQYSLLALGSLVFGMGELINHPRRQSFHPGFKITDRSRLNSLFGILLDAIGVALMATAAYRLYFM